MGIINLETVLNTTDHKGNAIAYYPSNGHKIFLNSNGETHEIGWLHIEKDGTIYYRKYEAEKDRYRKIGDEGGWTIPSIILNYVDTIQYQSDKRTYQIDAPKARLYGKVTRAKENLEEKVAIPVGAWDIIKSLDPTEAGRLEKFGVEWYNKLKDVIHSNVMNDLSSFLADRMKANKVYPKPEQLFRAFKETPLSKVKVVIMGNEPFEDSLADGLAFSFMLPFGMCPEVNHIQQELEREGDQIGFDKKHLFNPASWAAQGCLMLNQCLSVELNHERTHEGYGWEILTERAIRQIQATNKPIIFALLGTRTWAYERFIDSGYHTVIKADARNPNFVGSGVFSKINTELSAHNTKINW